MNYDVNKLDISPISNDTPSKLSALKSSIISRTNHDIPFFLMPLKMETRFMKPMRSILEDLYSFEVATLTGSLTSIISLVGKVSIYEGFVTESAHKAALELKDLFALADTEALSLVSLLPVEKADLLRALYQIDQTVTNAMTHLIAFSDDQNITDDITNNIVPALTSLKSSIQASINVATIDNSWVQSTSVEGNNLSNIVINKTNVCNTLLPNLGNGQNFNIPTFNALKNELIQVVEALNNGAFEYTIQDRQLIWMKMEPLQIIVNELNNAVASAPPNPQINANLYWLNKSIEWAWHNFSQKDTAPKEWLPAPEIANRQLSDDELAAIPQSISSLRANIENLLVANEAALTTLDNIQGAPDIFTLNSIVANVDQIKILIANSSLPFEAIETLYLWEKVSVLDVHLSHLDSIVGILSTTDPTGAAAITETLSLTSHSLTVEWAGKTGISTSIDVESILSFYTPVNELWIRVYPDDIFIHNLEEDLTLKEKEAGTEFWKEWWAARGDKKKEIAAWRALIALYGVTRGAWIVKVMTPSTISSTGTATKATGLVAKMGVLSTYTAKISTVVSSTASGVSAATPHFLSHYTPHLDYLTAAFTELPHMAASLSSIAVDEITSAKAEFASLSATILVENAQLANELSDIEAKFSTLTTTIQNTATISTWEVNYDANPTFPEVNVKVGTWTAAAYSTELPDSFVFAAINTKTFPTAPPATTPPPPSYDFNHIKVGNPVPLTLQMGIHPESSVFDLDAFENLKLDPELKWMFDFDEAVRIGMGVTIRLTNAEAKKGFDKVLVLGAKLGSTASVSTTEAHNYGKDLIEKLFKNHHYSGDGMSVLTLGTATNNTDNNDAGYKTPDADGSLSFATELGAPLFSRSLDKLKRKDGQWLADALGLEYGTFDHIENANKRQISGAIAMNQALWPGTIGNFMSEMMTPLFSKDNIERTKNYFSDYVLGRNTVPSIRVGSQPYGILPTTAYTRWKFPIGGFGIIPELPTASGAPIFPHSYSFLKFYNNKPGFNSEVFFQNRFQNRLLNVLKILNNTWLHIVEKKVKTVDKKPLTSSTSTQKEFMEILGADALMAEVYSRFMVNSSNFLTSNENFDSSAPSSKWNETGMVNVPFELFSLLNKLDLTDPLVSGIKSPIFDDVTAQNILTDLWYTGIPLSDADIHSVSKILNDSNTIFNIDSIKENPTTTGISSKAEYLLQGPTVDEKILSAIDSLTPIKGVNYVEWLLNAPLADVWKNNAFGNMQSRSLLFLLLRQSLLSTYRDTAMNTLVSLNEFSLGAMNAIGKPRGIAGQILHCDPQLILTKWHLLFKSRDFLLDNKNKLDLAYEFFCESTKFSSTSSRNSWWPAYDMTSTPTYMSSARPIRDFALTSASSSLSLADFLQSSSPAAVSSLFNDHTNWQGIQDLRKGFEHIKDLPTADLDLLLREHVDLASYRLDAWNAGMVNKRLWDNRNTESVFRKKGLYAGAYGWLLDVRPKEKPLVKLDASNIPVKLKDSSDTVYYDNSNLGFIHTPSIAHALTAAILRSGYISERNSADNKFAINLSSERVQLALSLLEGMRNGQSLNALLGYMFERGLHENYPDLLPLDEHIYNYRKVFPLEGSIAATSIDDKRNPTQVVDGIELLNAFRSASIISTALSIEPEKSIYEICISNATILSEVDFGAIKLPTHPSASRDSIIKEIDRIANAIDAVADLAIAEGVFQIAKGNAASSAATMEAFTEGKTPPMPEIVNTPVLGTHIAHKLVNMIEPISGTFISPWTGITISPRAKAEPSINQWIADLLYASFDESLFLSSVLPEKIGCLVNFNDIEDIPVSVDLSLANLDIQPIDLVYMVKESNFTVELSQRIKTFVRKTATNYDPMIVGIPSQIPLEVKLNEKGTGLYFASFWELHCLLNSIAHLIQQSRYLKAEDFVHGANPITHTGTIPPLFNLAELKSRTNDLYTDFNSDIIAYFETVASPINTTEINILRTKLLLAANYGIDFALPDSQIEDHSTALATELYDLALRVKSEILRRSLEAGAKMSIIHPSSSSSEIEQVSACLEIMTSLLGSGFKAMPHYSFDYYTGLEASVKAQLTASGISGMGIMRHHNSNPTALETLVDDWIYGLARVKDKVAHIETIRMLLFEDSSHSLKDMLPVQFPYIASPIEDYWLGATYPDTYELQGDKFSVAIFNHAAINTSSSYGYYAGWVLDEWNEVIPDKEVTTGISFNYDQPNAKPPQNVLLAVHPSYEGTWTLDDLWFTLLDTIEMAKIRMVEPDHFKKVDGETATDKFDIFKYVLPAIVGEVTPHNLDPTGDHLSYQGSESVQQVSFEYNPNNDKMPTEYVDPLKSGGSTTGSSSFMVKEGADWDKLDADSILSDEPLSDFMLFQDQLTSIANTQREMKEMQEEEEIINNPQQ